MMMGASIKTVKTKNESEDSNAINEKISYENPVTKLDKNMYDSVMNKDSIILHFSDCLFTTIEIVISQEKSFLDIANTIETLSNSKIKAKDLQISVGASKVNMYPFSKKSIKSFEINNFLHFRIWGRFDFNLKEKKIGYPEFTEINDMLIRDITVFNAHKSKKEQIEEQRAPYAQKDDNDYSNKIGHIKNPETRFLKNK